MIENLLWPMKLKNPPYLMVNPVAMFDTLNDGKRHKVPLINATPYDGYPPTIRLRGASADSLTIGLIFDLYKDGTNGFGFRGHIPLMFQQMGHEIVGCLCLGWHTATNDLTSNPDKAIEADLSKIDPLPPMFDFQNYDFENGETRPLFVMRGEDLENEGNLPQFNSMGAYSAISYVISSSFIVSNVRDGLFKSMWDEFYSDGFIDGKLAIEIIIRIDTFVAITPNGFKVGIYSQE